MRPGDRRLVCFDLGRVLIRICDNWQHGCRMAGVPVPGELDAGRRAALHEAVCRNEVGEIDVMGFAQLAAPVLGLAVEQVVAISNAYLLGPYAGVSELLDELLESGVETACLSNINDNHWRILNDPAGPHAEVMRRLRHPFGSHLLGVRKPSDACYACVERQTGIPGAQILFFDDLEENVAAARQRGWRGNRIDPAHDPVAQMRDHLRRYGLL